MLNVCLHSANLSSVHLDWNSSVLKHFWQTQNISTQNTLTIVFMDGSKLLIENLNAECYYCRHGCLVFGLEASLLTFAVMQLLRRWLWLGFPFICLLRSIKVLLSFGPLDHTVSKRSVQLWFAFKRIWLSCVLKVQAHPWVGTFDCVKQYRRHWLTAEAVPCT